MEKKENKFLIFLRRNSAYLILALCIIAVGLSVSIMIISKSNSPAINLNTPTINENPTDSVIPDEPSDSVDKPIVEVVNFIMPVENAISVARYSDKVVWNSTLERYSSHKATDFFAESGTSVLCVYDGTIKSVENSLLKGVSVTVDHGNGLQTVYNSLSEVVLVSEGQVVKSGDILGYVSASNRQESKDGAHLHFEVVEDGNSIDPIKYMVFDEK